MASEFSSNIREIAAEIKLYEKATAAAIRRAARAAVTKAGEGTVKAIKQKAHDEGLFQAEDATRLTVSFSVRSGGAKIATNRRKAPMARPLEKGSQGAGGAYNRHPVFGRKVYVNQPTRPYFYGTAQDRERLNEKELIEAVDVAIRAVGWRGI